MTMRAVSVRPLCLALAPLALLTACGDGSVVREEGGAAEAEGEVLGGTISDDMLPLDGLRSQSPPLKAAPAGAGEAATDADAAQGEGAAEGAAGDGDAATGTAAPAASEPAG